MSDFNYIYQIHRSKEGVSLFFNLQSRYRTLHHHHPDSALRAYYGYRFDEIENSMKRDETATNLTLILITALTLGEREIQATSNTGNMTTMNMGNILATLNNGKDIIKRLLPHPTIGLILHATDLLIRTFPEKSWYTMPYGADLAKDYRNAISINEQLEQQINPIRDIPHPFNGY